MKHHLGRKKHHKNILTILFAISFLAAITVGFLYINGSNDRSADPINAVVSDAQKFKAEYPSVSDDNHFVYASDRQTVSIFENGTGLVFLGFAKCPWCQSLSGLVDQAAKKEDLQEIDYLDISDHRKNNSQTYQALVAKLNPYLEKDEDGQPVIYVPDITAVKNGKIVGHFEMEEASKDEMAGGQDSYWTEARKNSAISQLQQMIKKIN